MQIKSQPTKVIKKKFPKVQTGSTKTQSKANQLTPPERLVKDAEYLAFIDWIATPAFERKPTTQQFFAKEWKVNEATLSQWKDRKGFWDKVERKMRVKARDKTSTLLGHFYNTMVTSRKPFGKDLELWLNFVQNWSKLIKVSDETETSSKLSPEDKKEMANALLKAGLANAKQVAKLISDTAEEEEDEEDDL